MIINKSIKNETKNDIDYNADEFKSHTEKTSSNVRGIKILFPSEKRNPYNIVIIYVYSYCGLHQHPEVPRLNSKQ